MIIRYLSILFLLSFNLVAEAQVDKPNIIVFLVDDLGWNDTSLPMLNEPTLYNLRYKTPNLEKLASQGITFTNAHAQPLCVPSRASFMTGQNFFHHNIIGDYAPTYNVANTIMIPAGNTLDEKIALPQILKTAGYKTIHAGKYHLCEHESMYPSPEEAGFDVNIAGSNFGAPGSYYSSDKYAYHDTLKNVPGLDKYFGTDTHLTDALTNEVLTEIDKSNKEEKPFFLYFAHYAVHSPMQLHKPYNDYHNNKGEKVDELKYASMIEGVDNSLGRVMQKLKDLDIEENTVLIFYSDNGGRVLRRGEKSLYGSFQHNYPLRSGKGSLYEGGVRVPGVVRWTGQSKENTRNDSPIIIEDLYATAVSISGAKLPSYHKIDGEDLTHIIKGGKTKKIIQDRTLFFNYPYRFDGKRINGENFDGGVMISSAILRKGWKLIYFQNDEHFELYNLAVDVGETNDLFNPKSELALELIKDLDFEMRRYNATVPVRLPQNSRVRFPIEAYENM